MQDLTQEQKAVIVREFSNSKSASIASMTQCSIEQVRQNAKVVEHERDAARWKEE